MSAKENPRIAIGEVLRREWIAGNVDGYEIGTDIGIHLGYYDEELGFPQIALTSVSSTARGNNGKAGWDASGAGHIHEYAGRVDVNIHTGSVDDVDSGEDPDLAAETIGGEVRGIMHAADGLVDPITGKLLCNSVGPVSEPTTEVDTDGAMAEYSSTVELEYVRMVKPPDR